MSLDKDEKKIGGRWCHANQKAIPSKPKKKEGMEAPRGLRARHAIKGNKANVGDPIGSSQGVSTDKYKSEEVEIANRESDGS